MIIAQELELQEDIWADVIFPPSDLYSDEPPVESELHLEQTLFQGLFSNFRQQH